MLENKRKKKVFNFDLFGFASVFKELITIIVLMIMSEMRFEFF